MNKALLRAILFLVTISSISCTKDEDEEYIPVPVSKARLYAGGETTVF